LNSFYLPLKRFLHDPIDKPFDIPTHIVRAREYADILGVSGLEEAKTSDQIASCMERSLLPSGVKQEFNEIRHPLCEGKLGVSCPDLKEVSRIVKDTLKEIAGRIYHYNDKDKFFYLWRNLFQIIFEKTKNKSYSKFWSVIPADTRVPDHSIWEHLKVSSAINAFDGFQNNSLFLFTLGPVQSFISQARKAQDLFTGSFILSYLTFIGIREILDRYGPTSIIYPDLFAQPLMDWYLEKKINIKNSSSSQIEIPTVPNRFVAIMPETDEAKITEVAQSIINKVENEWNKISTTVLLSFEINKDERIEKQLQDFPQIYWVALPWWIDDKNTTINDLSAFVPNEETERLKKLFKFASEKGEFKPNIGLFYQVLYTFVEKSMGVRKNLRNFNQKKERGKKCSICGEKEAFIKARMGKLKVGKFISDKEELCALCFAKRGLEKYFYKEFRKELNFPSTAEVSLSDFKERALKDANKEFAEFIRKFKKISKSSFQQAKVNPLPKIAPLFTGIENLEGEWFFEENLRKEAFEKYLDIPIDKSDLGELKIKLKDITDKVGNPNPYFAVILLDGDNMGKWLSGKLLPSIEYAYNSEVWKILPDDFKNKLKEIAPQKILTPAIHSAISTALRNYSIEFVREIIEEEHLGKIVYSGGDDLLAFINLKDLFAVMRKLRAAFSGQIKFQNKEIEVDWENKTGFVEKDNKLLLTMGKKATASMGVIIAHYKMPLRIVLTKLRKMEKKAKDLSGKDAFCIALLKHSGEERTGLSKWRYNTLDVIKEIEELSKRMIKRRGKPYFSDKFIHNLKDEFLKFADERRRFTAGGEIFNIEFKRLINRAYNGDESKKEEFVKKVYDPLKEIFWSTGADIQNFLHLLEISVFISREAKE